MNNLDEKILQKRKEKRMQLYNNLQDGYYIDDQIINFSQKKILDNFYILLPETFKQMPDELAKVKYPVEFRPQRIYTSQDLRINFCFSLFPEQMQFTDFKSVIDRVMNTLKKEIPGCVFLDTGSFDSIPGSWFSFQSAARDSNIYNMMFISKMKGCLLQGVFNCPTIDQEQWSPIVVPVWESISLIEREDK